MPQEGPRGENAQPGRGELKAERQPHNRTRRRTGRRKMKRIMGAATVAGLLIAAVHPAQADAVEDFYRRTDVHFTVGVAVGGSYDTTGRLVARHIGKYIPGKPKVQITN